MMRRNGSRATPPTASADGAASHLFRDPNRHMHNPHHAVVIPNHIEYMYLIAERNDAIVQWLGHAAVLIDPWDRCMMLPPPTSKQLHIRNSIVTDVGADLLFRDNTPVWGLVTPLPANRLDPSRSLRIGGFDRFKDNMATVCNLIASCTGVLPIAITVFRVGLYGLQFRTAEDMWAARDLDHKVWASPFGEDYYYYNSKPGEVLEQLKRAGKGRGKTYPTSWIHMGPLLESDAFRQQTVNSKEQWELQRSTFQSLSTAPPPPCYESRRSSPPSDHSGDDAQDLRSENATPDAPELEQPSEDYAGSNAPLGATEDGDP